MSIRAAMIKPVSGMCNMNCSYCFYKDEMNMRDIGLRSAMSNETLENTVKKLIHAADDELTLIFQGGEPTLAGLEFYRNVLKFERMYNTRDIEITHSIQTNGLEISDKLLDLFKEEDYLMGVSVDATKLLHDEKRLDAFGDPTYDRVQETIEKIIKRQILCNVLCVIDERSANSGDKVIKALSRYNYIQIIPRLEPLTGENNPDALTSEGFGKFLIGAFREYSKELRKGKDIYERYFNNILCAWTDTPKNSCTMEKGCTANCVIEADGSVYPCDFYCIDKYCMGNINDMSLLRLLKTDTMKDFIDTSLIRSSECDDCEYECMCGGGCRREYDETNKSRLCEGYKMFFSSCLDEINSLTRHLGLAEPY